MESIYSNGKVGIQKMQECEEHANNMQLADKADRQVMVDDITKINHMR